MKRLIPFLFALLLALPAAAQLPPGGLAINYTPISGGISGDCLSVSTTLKLTQVACGGGTAANITVATTTITGGTASGILWNNAGVLAAGPATTDGSGNISLPASSTIQTASGTLNIRAGSGGVINILNNGGGAAVQLNGGTFEVVSAGGFTWSSTTGISTADTFLLRGGPANIQLGAAAVDTGPVAQTLSVQNTLAGGTSNVAGANTTFAMSQGKGTGAGGSLIVQTAAAGSTGTTVNALATSFSIDSTSSAVFGYSTQNGITITPSATGNSAVIASTGTDTNIQMRYRTKGNEEHYFQTGTGVTLAKIANSGTSTTNYVVLAGGASVNASITTNTGGLTITPTLTLASQLIVSAMTQTSVAQTGTVCYNSGTGAVTYDATLGCLTSSVRFKTDIVDIQRPDALALTMALAPVSFRKRTEFGGDVDPSYQVGFIAEQVADVDERLIARGEDGSVRGVRYQQMTAILAGAIQELDRKIMALEARH